MPTRLTRQLLECFYSWIDLDLDTKAFDVFTEQFPQLLQLIFNEIETEHLHIAGNCLRELLVITKKGTSNVLRLKIIDKIMSLQDK